MMSLLPYFKLQCDIQNVYYIGNINNTYFLKYLMKFICIINIQKKKSSK